MEHKRKQYHYLYKTTNLMNNKYYYGIHSTNNLEDGYLGSGTYLKRSIRKYGKDNFKREIIKMFDTREELVQAEIEIITEDILRDSQNMNCQFGGEVWNTTGMVTVRDKDGNTFNVFKDDPRFLSGELVGATKGKINVRNENGDTFQVYITDSRYLSGELFVFMKNKVVVKDKNGKTFQVNINDSRYLSGELVNISKDTILVKDKNGNALKVNKNDKRYLSGELVGIFTDKKHSDETKNKISEKAKLKFGNLNSSFGTCWITKDNENKKIKKEELNQYLNDGWSKGRKMK